MICQVCQRLLYSHARPRASEPERALSFWHHDNEENVRDSAEDAECYICRVICNRLDSLGDEYRAENLGGRFITASLIRVSGWSGVYRLDFTLDQSRLEVASFVLQEHNDSAKDGPQANPISVSTSDPKVFELAKTWIEECESSHLECRLVSSTDWYPTRLIDLWPMEESENRLCRLISQKEGEKRPDQPSFEGRYVTLSHRWGGLHFPKLGRHNLSDYQTDMLLEDMPLTFRHAMIFARSLGIRWIWIDALCILQQDEEDWLYESSQMDKVYRYSYCNISATSAPNSTVGLFRDRDPEKQWFDIVRLKTEGLTMDAPETVRCTISDLTFWPEQIDHGAVNRRSWVLQERLLAARVIHWCEDQIAFECRRLDRAECRPEGLPNLQIKAGQLFDQARLKAMDSMAGRRLYKLRLEASQGILNPSSVAWKMEQINPKLFIYEVWKRIVEIYTRLEITNQSDRLIALSGIARMMAATLEADGTKDQYVAGMWKNHLESQLLWYVNDDKEKSTDKNPLANTRPKTYRAPSFSWASVETTRGVTFPETTDQNILVELQLVRLIYKTEIDMYGILTDAYLVLKGLLRKIVLTDRFSPEGDSATYHEPSGNRFSWQLTANGIPFGESQSIVYLDSPATKPSVFGPAARVYCLPVSQDDRHLNCLILQAMDGDHGVRYKRVGLTQIMTLHEDDVNSMTKQLTEPPGRKETVLGKSYRGSNESFQGESHICII